MTVADNIGVDGLEFIVNNGLLDNKTDKYSISEDNIKLFKALRSYDLDNCYFMDKNVISQKNLYGGDVLYFNNRKFDKVFIRRSFVPSFKFNYSDINHLELEDVSICYFSIRNSSIQKTANIYGGSFDIFGIQNSKLEADLHLNGIRTFVALMLDGTQSNREMILGHHHGPYAGRNSEIPLIVFNDKLARKQSISESGILLHDETMSKSLIMDRYPRAVISGKFNLSGSKWRSVWITSVIFQKEIKENCEYDNNYSYFRANGFISDNLIIKEAIFGDICEFIISRGNISNMVSFRNSYINSKMKFFDLRTRRVNFKNTIINKNVLFSLSEIDSITSEKSIEDISEVANSIVRPIIDDRELLEGTYKYAFPKYKQTKGIDQNKLEKYNLFLGELDLDFSKIGVFDGSGMFVGDLKCLSCRVENFILSGIIVRTVDFAGAKIERLAFGYNDMGLLWCRSMEGDTRHKAKEDEVRRLRLNLAGSTIRSLHANAVDLSLQDCSDVPIANDRNRTAPLKAFGEYLPVPTAFQGMRVEGIGGRLTSIEHARLPGEKVEETGGLTATLPMFGNESGNVIAWLKSPGSGWWQGSQLVSGGMRLAEFNFDTFSQMARLLDSFGFSDAAKDLKIEASRLKKERSIDFVDKVRLVIGAPLQWGFKNENALIAALVLLMTGAWVSAVYRAYPHTLSPPDEKQFREIIRRRAPYQRILASRSANFWRIATCAGFLCCIVLIFICYYLITYSQGIVWAVSGIIVAVSFILATFFYMARGALTRPTISMSWKDCFSALFKINVHDIFFSLDRLVPVVGWHNHWGNYPMIGQFGRNYYYFHRLLGLLIFVYAFSGVTGLLD